MEKQFEYDVFLSFSSVDKEYVRGIWQKLIGSGLRVFWSDESLKEKVGAEDWSGVIEKSLLLSQHFLFLSSNEAVASYWVQQEYTSFINLCHSKDVSNRLFAILPVPGFDSSQLPPFLQNKQIAKTLSEVISQLGGHDFKKEKAEKEALKEELALVREHIAKEKRQHAQEFVSFSGEKQTLLLRIEALTLELGKKGMGFADLSEEKQALSLKLNELILELDDTKRNSEILIEENRSLLLQTEVDNSIPIQLRDSDEIIQLLEQKLLNAQEQSHKDLNKAKSTLKTYDENIITLDLKYATERNKATKLIKENNRYREELENSKEQWLTSNENLKVLREKSGAQQHEIANLSKNTVQLKSQLEKSEANHTKEPTINSVGTFRKYSPTILIIALIAILYLGLRLSFINDQYIQLKSKKYAPPTIISKHEQLKVNEALASYQIYLFYENNEEHAQMKNLQKSFVVAGIKTSIAEKNDNNTDKTISITSDVTKQERATLKAMFPTFTINALSTVRRGYIFIYI
ncbi:MAG: hypothetical protein ACI8WB_001709 [Phenylobacterium sp.]|jgi:hypothetical protein